MTFRQGILTKRGGLRTQPRGGRSGLRVGGQHRGLTWHTKWARGSGEVRNVMARSKSSSRVSLARV